MLQIVLVILFCPFDIIYRSTRFFFIQSLFRCLRAPLYKVTLSDFFLADQLTSQVQAIRSLDLYICYYSLGEVSQRQDKCHGHGVYNVLYFAVALIPYWTCLLQCLHRLFEEKAAVHGYGGLNYFLTIVAILIRAAFELKKGTVSSAVTTILSTYLELVMDWGLLRRHSKNAYLRDKLLVPHKSVYFAAMALDMVLRVAWVQIENEHLNNVGKLWALKSVPLPCNYIDEDSTKGD
ncbi:EXS (ERD1/XPR1/SYG1) family protein [Theobroma cacao]|uniref:EXS (ERD1/XPR1/SYG1) family protein n=1 Tax=Theobroma cacao TaxID=3641 RepID=A0A061EBS3_THECC|nr:EXS (ERD1/XPR1/SYG1) family protein [Theobroma cacao]